MNGFMLAWWFFYVWQAGSQVGPFPTQRSCETIRQAHPSVPAHSTPCWWDGKE